MKIIKIIVIISLRTILTAILISSKADAQQMTDYRGPVFPANHALNMPIDSLPVHPNSINFITSIGLNAAIHPDFGTSWDDGGTLRQIGIPYNVVGADQPLVPITFVLYPEESDPGPWPIPPNPYIETVFDWRDPDEGDRHMLIVDSSAHILYETGGVYGNSNGSQWQGGCGAIFDLNSNNLRPETWTSADAAGLPIFPLLIRYDEVERAIATGGELHHPIRFTVVNTQRAYIWPARHYASSSTDPNRPPMGLRVRLKADVDISGFSSRMQVILRTMKKYGLIVSDNGSNWFFQGTHDDRWNDEELSTLRNIHGRDFEAVDVSAWMARPGFDPNSATVPPASVSAIPLRETSNLKPDFFLYQNYPNPFDVTTVINYSLVKSGYVCLKVYDLLGREIVTLIGEVKAAGLHTVEWDGKNSAGQDVNSGIYFYQLVNENGLKKTKRMILVKGCEYSQHYL
jgi:hypothetical protein